MKTPAVSLVTVTYNSADDLPGLVESIRGASGLFVEVVAVDNASSDGSADLVEKSLPDARVIRNASNTGFAGGANAGIEATSSDYVLLVNPDLRFGPDFVRRLADALDADPKAGSAAPLLMRPDGVTVDSAGLAMQKNRKAVDRGRDRPLTPDMEKPARIFGPCGAAALYRRSALEDARVAGEIFDESFFAYKEDVDLAWRMALLGWDCAYVPGAAGTHERGWKTSARKKVPKAIRRQSYLNRYLCMIKNDDPSSMLLHLPLIAFYELKLLVYALFVEPFLFGAYPVLARSWGETMAKRAEIMKKRKRGPRGMRGLFGL